MRAGPFVLCVLVAVCGGCRKKSSRQYYDAEGRHSVLVARLGDGAYLDAEMGQVITLLQAVPPSAKEAPQASALLARIETETDRVKREAAARDAPGQVQPPTVAPSLGSGSALRPVASSLPVDGGAPEERPTPQMAEKDFAAKFGKCVGSGSPAGVPNDKQPGTLYMVLDSPDCQKKLGGAGGQLGYVFFEGVLRGTMLKTTSSVEVPRDAGAFEPVFQDAGSVVIWPGRPLPEGSAPGTTGGGGTP